MAENDRSQMGRELIAALISVVILVMSMVTGYYLGRAPAELRAKTATGLLDQATTVAKQAEQQTDDVKREARDAAEAALAVLNETPLGADRANATRSLGDAERSLLARTDVEEARRRLRSWRQ